MKLPNFQKFAVLGAGTMGSQIAGYLAGQGFPVIMLDKKKDGVSLAHKAYDQLIPLGRVASPSHRLLIQPAVTGEDDALLGTVDFIIEAVFEEYSAKKEAYDTAERYRKENTPVVSNSSGLSLSSLCAGRNKNFQDHFLGMHFFNPVLSCQLLEFIPLVSTHQQVVSDVLAFVQKRIGKGIVIAPDRPNYIANRYGVAAMQFPFFAWEEGLSVQDIDTIFKILFGWEPLKTCDLVGIQLMEPVASNVYKRVTEGEDPFWKYFGPVDKIQALVSQGFTGRYSTAGRGFYTKIPNRGIYMYDFATSSYAPAVNSEFPSLQNALSMKRPDLQMLALWQGDDPAAQFAKKCFVHLAAYALFLTEQICGNDPSKLDHCMEWGYNWPCGPVRLIQMVGWKQTVQQIRDAGLEKMLPSWVDRVEDGKLYDNPMDPKCFYYHGSETVTTHGISGNNRIIDFSSLRKDDSKVIFSNKGGGAVLDLGDNVCLAAFESGTLNPAGPAVLNLIEEAIDWAEEKGGAVVVGNSNPRAFCAGADLKWVLEKSRGGDFKAIEELIRSFQDTTQRMTYSPVPVVTCPHGLTLGGGNEIAMAGNLTVANAQLIASQPEFGVGLVAAGGGFVRMMRTVFSALPHDVLWGEAWTAEMAEIFLGPIFKAHTQCLRSNSAAHARDLGFLRPTDVIIQLAGMGQQHVLWVGKQKALALLQGGFIPPAPFVFNLSKGLASSFHVQIQAAAIAKVMPTEQALITKKIGDIISGANLTHERATEQDVLDQEREAFLYLVGRDSTRQAMAAVVEKKK